MGFTDTGTLS